MTLLPSFPVDLDRLTHVKASTADKQLRTFMSRPPLLCRRYATTKMPLGLTEEQLMANEDDLETHKGNLDEHGWSSFQKTFLAGDVGHGTRWR